MKQFLPVVWWLTATLVIAFVLVGLGYLFADALLLGVLFLPGMLTARYFVPQLSFENRRQGILDTVYLALAILGIEYLSLMLGWCSAPTKAECRGCCSTRPSSCWS